MIQAVLALRAVVMWKGAYSEGCGRSVRPGRQVRRRDEGRGIRRQEIRRDAVRKQPADTRGGGGSVVLTCLTADLS